MNERLQKRKEKQLGFLWKYHFWDVDNTRFLEVQRELQALIGDSVKEQEK